MRRSIVMLLSIVVVFGTLLAGGKAFATAQGSTDYSGHPLVGAWLLITDPEPGASPSTAVFSSDGAYIEVEGEGGMVIGAWEPTGDSTANMMFTGYDSEGGFRVRASIEVAADGQSLSGTYSFEFVLPDTGEGTGEYGPTVVTGTRLAVEPQGTPLGPIEDAFAQFEEGEDATPEP